MKSTSRGLALPIQGHLSPRKGVLLGFIGVASVPLVASGFVVDIGSIPFFVLQTLFRMTLAYLLSLAFALAYGITTSMNHKASHVLLPLLDILQSVPVLGFLPVVFIFFITN